MTMFRSLLPGPRRGHPQVETQAPSNRTPIGKPRHILSACVPCQLRRSRCDGARPQCLSCLRRNVVCQYKAAPGETPSQASRRKCAELQQRSNTYEELFRILATTSESGATQILSRIRKGDNVQAILQSIQEADLLLQLHITPDIHYRYSFPYSKSMPTALLREGNPYLDSWLYKFSYEGYPGSEKELSTDDSVIYNIPYHAAEIVDPRLDVVRAKTWTKVIDDDTLLKKLLQSYFLTEYTWYPAFQKDYFLEDMTVGGKRYCSSLLVNAILAAACHSYPNLTSRAEFWDPRTLGYQFLAEARRLWELEVGRARLTTIQAAIVLSVVTDGNGSDKIGKSYLMHAVSAAHALQLFSKPVQVVDHAQYNARAITAWALFGLQAVHSFHVFELPLLPSAPDVALPDISGTSNCYGEFWLRYPSSKKPVPVNYRSTFKAMSEFRAIINDIAVTFFGPAQPAPNVIIGRIQAFCIRLNNWYQNLPTTLTAREICFPWQLKLHMHYYNVIIYLLETLCMSSRQASSDTSVQKTLQDATIRYETLLRLYYLRHGFELYDLFMVHLISFLGFLHLKGLQSSQPSELEDTRSSVVLSAKGLREQSRSCYLAGVVFRILKAKLGVQGQHLLKDIDDIPEEGQKEEMELGEQVNSSWPIDLQWIDVNAHKQRLENLVKETTELHL